LGDLVLHWLLLLLALNRGPGANLYNAFQIPVQLRGTIVIVGCICGLAALFGMLGAAAGWFPSTG